MTVRSGSPLKTLIKGSVLALALGVAGAAHAWPQHAIKMIVPFPAAVSTTQ